METGVLQTVENRRHLGQIVGVGDVLDQAADLLLVHLIVQEGIVRRQHIVEDDAADRGLDALAFLVVLEHAEGGGHLRVVGQTHLDLGLQVQIGAGVVGVQSVIEIDEHATLAGEAVAHGRQVVQADDHVLGRHGQRMAVGRGLDVVGGQHQHAGLGLSLGAQRHVHSHLVAVEVGVEGGADERMQLDGLALDEHRLEGLDAQTVQGWCAVQQHRMVDDDLFQHVPHVAGTAIDGTLGGLDVGGILKLDQALHDEGLEQLQRHLLGQTALVHLQLRADDDNGTAGVVNTLAQQVLTEAALLALQQIGKALQCAVVGAGDGTAAAAIIDEAVNCFLQHTLLVAHDDVRSAQLQQAAQTVVAVDDAAVQVIQVGGGEAAAVQLDHGAQVRRQHGQHVHDHPLGAVAGNAESLDDFQTLQDTHLLLAGGLLHLGSQLSAELVEVDLLQQVLNGLSTHRSLELVAVALAHLAVLFLGQQLLLFQRGQTGVGDDIACKVEDLLQQAGADVQHQADAAGDALEVPDVAHRSGQLDVAHTLTADLGLGHLDAAAVADLALITDALILAAVALPVLGRSKNALAVQTVALRLQGAVVDGLRLLHLAIAPVADLVRRGKADFDRIEDVVFHETNPFLIFIVSMITVDVGRPAALPCPAAAARAPRRETQLSQRGLIIRRCSLRQKRTLQRQSCHPPARRDHRNQHRRP